MITPREFLLALAEMGDDTLTIDDAKLMLDADSEDEEEDEEERFGTKDGIIRKARYGVPFEEFEGGCF